MNNRRLWIFRVLALVLVPTIVLGFFELGLRVLGSGYSTDFVTKSVVNGVPVYRENLKFTWQYFPVEIARSPLFFSFPAEKADNTYRIFVLGGSAAQGDPEPSYGFSRILEAMLERRYPEAHFEVINAGVTAINSHVVYQIAKDLAPHDGDLFIVYLGNNEVLGPFGAGTVFAPLAPNLPLIRLGTLAKSSRLGQSLVQLSNLVQPQEGQLDRWRGMEMFLDQQVRADDPEMETVYHHFQANLEDIVTVARRAKAPVIVSTVGVNLENFSPLASQHRGKFPEQEKARWDALYMRGIEHLKAGRYEKAKLQFLEAEKTDESYAALQFLLGRCFGELGDYSEAESRYRRARDLDTLRFRADSRINQIIRDVVTHRTDEGIFLVDSVKALEATSKHGIPGSDLFYEHVHMTFKGNYVIAKSLMAQIETIMPPSLAVKSKSPLPTLEESMQALAFTVPDQHRVAELMTQRLALPPYTNQVDHEEEIGYARRQEEQLRNSMTSDSFRKAQQEYSRALQMTQDDPLLHYNFGMLNYTHGDYEGAALQFESLLALLPHHHGGRERLAASLIKLGKLKAAVDQLQETLRFNPNFHTARYSLAFVHSKLGNFDEAIAIYEEAALLDPAVLPDTYNELGRLYIQKEQYSEAIKALQKGIRISTVEGQEGTPDMQYNLGVALKRNGQAEASMQALSEAASSYLELLEKEPHSATLYFALGSVYVEKREFQNAAQAFQRASEENPADFQARINLIKSLEAQNHLNEALEALDAGISDMLRADQLDSARALQSYRNSLQIKMN